MPVLTLDIFVAFLVTEKTKMIGDTGIYKGGAVSSQEGRSFFVCGALICQERSLASSHLDSPETLPHL